MGIFYECNPIPFIQSHINMYMVLWNKRDEKDLRSFFFFFLIWNITLLPVMHFQIDISTSKQYLIIIKQLSIKKCVLVIRVSVCVKSRKTAWQVRRNIHVLAVISLILKIVNIHHKTHAHWHCLGPGFCGNSFRRSRSCFERMSCWCPTETTFDTAMPGSGRNSSLTWKNWWPT